MTADIHLWRKWLNGKNTFEISQAFGLKEHDVERRINKLREDLRHAARVKEERAVMFEKYFADLSRKKRGFTGRETVSGHPRGCA